MHDKAGMGRAYGNIGNAYSAAGIYEEAIKYHKQELTISKEVNDRTSEAATHGNLAVAFQALGKHEMALVHYHSHLNIARELKDVAGEFSFSENYKLLKYGSQKKVPFWCRCSIFLSLTFVEIKKSFTKTLLVFNSKNYRIICYWK